MSFPTIVKPIKSPFLDEFDSPTFVDDQGNVLGLMAVVQPTSNGVTSLTPSNVKAVPNSQVTGKRQRALVGTNQLPTVALVSVNPSTGALIPFQASSAASATTAASVSGKFQSTVRVATGSAESIAHGLGVVPSLVLVSIYDDTNAGVLASGFTIVEGTHTSTNIVVTVTANAKYKVIAFA